MNCIVCKRPLTNKASIMAGIGPVCSAKQRLEDKEHPDMIYDQSPLNLGVMIHRYGDHKKVTNVPWICVSHSPDGFEWGYGGSGPSDLALNIIENVLRYTGHKEPQSKCSVRGEAFYLTWAIYQDFKREFIATMPNDGGTIPLQRILDWIETKKEG